MDRAAIIVMCHHVQKAVQDDSWTAFKALKVLVKVLRMLRFVTD